MATKKVAVNDNLDDGQVNTAEKDVETLVETESGTPGTPVVLALGSCDKTASDSGDCEKENQKEIIAETGNLNADDTIDGSDSSPESSDIESDEDSSWMESDDDSSGSDHEEYTRMTVQQMPEVNFSLTNVKSLGLWLSDTGPVQLNTMCHCKGMCIKKCACRMAGISCSVRCGCKVDLCRWRRPIEEEEEIPDEKAYKEKLRAKKTVAEDDGTNKTEKNLPTSIKHTQHSMDEVIMSMNQLKINK